MAPEVHVASENVAQLSLETFYTFSAGRKMQFLAIARATGNNFLSSPLDNQEREYEAAFLLL